MTFQLVNDKDVLIMVDDNGITTFVPMDEENRDYKIYLEWLAQGNEPLPAE